MSLAALPFASAASQQPSAPPRPLIAPSGRPTVACMGQRVDDIVVFSEAPSVANLKRVPVVAQIARTLHTTTRSDVIRRFLLLDQGQPCSELRRAESERILRAQPYIADAAIYVVANSEGGVDLEVRTSDEASLVIGGSFRAKAPVVSYLLLGNANLGGQGVFVSGSWRYGDGFRDALAGRVTDHQFLGKPWELNVEGERASLGGSWRSELKEPFLTDLQRLAWRVRGGMVQGYSEFREPNGDVPTIALKRTYFDLGGIFRVGPPGRLSLFGASLSGEEERSGNRLVIPENGEFRDIGPSPHIYLPHKIARANLLWGVRDIAFTRREGLDALAATQDVPIGFQIGTQFGRSLTVLGSREDDIFMAGDLYIGAASGIATLRIQAQGEGRRSTGASEWDGVLTTGRITHNLQFSPRNLNTAIVEWSAGFRQRTPFQLLLAIPEGGVRGYEQSGIGGGQRVVARLEQRYTMGRLLDIADTGLGFFVDVGRVWAGDVPFGINTGVKSSVGISLLAAFPPKSARLWRADLAFPTSTGANARWTIKFTNSDRTQFVYHEARDVADGRELTVPSSIFAWP
jgi:hypothetical protein